MYFRVSPLSKALGCRLPFLLGLLAGGWSKQQILENYPQLTKESSQALFGFAQECLQEEALFQLS